MLAALWNVVPKAGAIPTWIGYLLLRKFVSKSHPWRQSVHSLASWHQSQSPHCRTLDVFIAGVIFDAILVIIVLRYTS
jgi:hypothetical protein